MYLNSLMKQVQECSSFVNLNQQKTIFELVIAPVPQQHFHQSRLPNLLAHHTALKEFPA